MSALAGDDFPRDRAAVLHQLAIKREATGSLH